MSVLLACALPLACASPANARALVATELWVHAIPPAPETRAATRLDPNVLSGPVVHGNAVFVLGPAGLDVLDLANGHLLRRQPLAQEGLSLVAAEGGLALFSTGHQRRRGDHAALIFALERDWAMRIARVEGLSCSPGDLRLRAGALLAVSQDGSLRCLDARTGRLRWARSVPGRLEAWCAVPGGDVIAVTSRHRLMLLDGLHGRSRWHVGPVDVSGRDSLVADAGNVYVGGASPTAYRLDTGAIAWVGASAPLALDRRLLLAEPGGPLICMGRTTREVPLKDGLVGGLDVESSFLTSFAPSTGKMLRSWEPVEIAFLLAMLPDDVACSAGRFILTAAQGGTALAAFDAATLERVLVFRPRRPGFWTRLVSFAVSADGVLVARYRRAPAAPGAVDEVVRAVRLEPWASGAPEVRSSVR